MGDYQIYEPTPEDEAKRRADGLFWFDHILGNFNFIDVLIGELQMATDSRGKRRRNRGQGGRLRIVLHREAPQAPKDVTDLLNRYGIRVRKYLHDGNNFYFTVRASQADWAVKVLDGWKGGTLGASWAEKKADRERAQRGRGLWDRLMGGV